MEIYKHYLWCSSHYEKPRDIKTSEQLFYEPTYHALREETVVCLAY